MRRLRKQRCPRNSLLPKNAAAMWQLHKLRSLRNFCSLVLNVAQGGWAAESKALTLVKERCYQEVVLAEADDRHRHGTVAQATESKQCLHFDDAAIERIWMEVALCTAPLDAMLAEIACKEAAFETGLSPRHPPSYVDAVLSTMGGGHTTIFAPRCLSFGTRAGSTTRQ